MEITLGVTPVNRGRRTGRIVVRADDPSLTPYAGLAVSGELARRLRLAELIDAELAVERRARPVKVRRRGRSPGELAVSLAECQLVGGEFFADVEDVRADRAGAGLRAVAATLSAPTALQNAKQFRCVHVQRVKRAAARVGEHVDRALGRDVTEPPVIDLDATQVEVYGAFKHGAARSRLGAMSYAPHVAFWSQRGRALTSELVGGNREKLTGPDCARIATRALRLLPEGHAPAIFRIDSAYYQLELLERLRKERSRFTVSVPRNQAMWKALAEIPESAWADALEMPGAQVAETTYRPGGWKHEPLRPIVRRVPFTASEIAKRRGSRRLKTIHPEQLQLALEGKVASVYGYSFILTDIHWRPADDGACLRYLERLRWGDGFVCRFCGSVGGGWWQMADGLRRCAVCRSETSVTAGTIFAGTRTPLVSWFAAVWYVVNQKQGVSALGLQRVLGLGSYQTAWAWLHKLGRAMVRPDRDALDGIVEVDETLIGGVKPGKRGRGADGKVLVAIGVEVHESGPGRVRMRRITDASADTLTDFVLDHVARGAEVHTDAWGGYNHIGRYRFRHVVTNISASGDPAHVVMPEVHRVASLLKRWLLGTHQGAVSHDQLDYYLDEYTFRFNRRRSRHRGLLFYRLLESAVSTSPHPYNSLTSESAA